MKLVRYEYPQASAASAFNRLFDLGAPGLDRFNSLFDEFFGEGAGPRQPAADLYEDAQNYYARMEFPGVKKEAIDLELENSVLTVSFQREEKTDHAKGSASIHRSISVPDGVALDQVSAALEDGILTVTMPKAPERKARQISVK